MIDLQWSGTAVTHYCSVHVSYRANHANSNEDRPIPYCQQKYEYRWLTDQRPASHFRHFSGHSSATVHPIHFKFTSVVGRDGTELIFINLAETETEPKVIM